MTEYTCYTILASDIPERCMHESMAIPTDMSGMALLSMNGATSGGGARMRVRRPPLASGPTCARRQSGCAQKVMPARKSPNATPPTTVKQAHPKLCQNTIIITACAQPHPIPVNQSKPDKRMATMSANIQTCRTRGRDERNGHAKETFALCWPPSMPPDSPSEQRKMSSTTR